MGKYEYIQTTAALRNQNNVKAHKILDIQGNHLIIQLWLNSDKQEGVMVSMPEEYKAGQYIDLQIARTSKTSYQIRMIGRTPKAFVPTDGRNISI